MIPPLRWINFPRKTWVNFDYKSIKGYRFINKPVNAIPYSAFEELSAIYDFDAKLVSGL